ncbi:unnamed protein product [Fraxinus pennsylvanica]|uniref:Uncharacterized protein n=1 Tax=Fraxinus pennsylvanica TaxID=56036 RepID=A0AAD2A808_9LAMI|nr:unnamed protein product [Fraxinus pennsylvanica]
MMNALSFRCMSRKGKMKKEKKNLENIDEDAVPFGEDNVRQVISSDPTRQEACTWLGTFDMAEEVAMAYGQDAFSLLSSSLTSGPSTTWQEKNELEYLDDSVLEELLESSEEQQKK